MPILEDHISPIRTFAASFSLSAFAGLVAHLREGKPWTWVSGLTAACGSGCLGLALAMIWYQKFQDNIYFLIGVCVLAGLAGRPMVDAVSTDFVAAFRRSIGRWFGLKSTEDFHVADPPKPDHEVRDSK